MQKILAPVDRAVAKMGFESWEALIQFLRSGVEIVGPGVLDSTGKSIRLHLTGESKTTGLGAENPHEAVLAIDSREKLIQLFAVQPEPTTSELKQLLIAINGLLAHYRTAFLEVGKRMAHHVGGRPVLIPDEKTQQAIRKDIQDLLSEEDEFGNKVQLEDALVQIAARWRAKLNLGELSVTTVHRIWNRSGSYTLTAAEES